MLSTQIVSSMVKIRLIWADSLKGVLILLVLLGHAIQYTIGEACYTNHLWNMIYSFHMPAFMAVSGFLAYKVEGAGPLLSTIWRRFQQLMIPYLSWSFLIILIDGNFNVGRIQELILFPDKGLWFLWVLFFIIVIFNLCGWIAEKLKVNMAFIVFMIGLPLVLFTVFCKIKLLGIQFIAYYFIFYASAYYFHKYYDKFATVKSWLLALLGAIWGFLAWFWQMHEIPSFLAWIPIPATIVQYMYRFITAFIAIYVLLVLSPQVLDTNSKWNIPMMIIGKLSLGVYSINFFVLGHIVPLMKESGLSESMTILFSFIMGSICAWVIIWVLAQWRFTARCLLGKV